MSGRKMKKINKELDMRMKELSINHHHSSSGKSRQKRPYRLIPVHKTKEPDDGNDIINPQPLPFYGPPTNCSDMYLN